MVRTLWPSPPAGSMPTLQTPRPLASPLCLRSLASRWMPSYQPVQILSMHCPLQHAQCSPTACPPLMVVCVQRHAARLGRTAPCAGAYPQCGHSQDAPIVLQTISANSTQTSLYRDPVFSAVFNSFASSLKSNGPFKGVLAASQLGQTRCAGLSSQVVMPLCY